MNPLTNSMERLTRMLLNTDNKLKKMGEMGYGLRKATPAEQKQMYENLTPEKLFQLIDKHGLAKVNTWMAKHEEKQNG